MIRQTIWRIIWVGLITAVIALPPQPRHGSGAFIAEQEARLAARRCRRLRPRGTAAQRRRAGDRSAPRPREGLPDGGEQEAGLVSSIERVFGIGLTSKDVVLGPAECLSQQLWMVVLPCVQPFLGRVMDKGSTTESNNSPETPLAIAASLSVKSASMAWWAMSAAAS